MTRVHDYLLFTRKEGKVSRYFYFGMNIEIYMAHKIGCIHLVHIYLGLKGREKMLHRVKICLLNIADEEGCLSGCPFYR